MTLELSIQNQTKQLSELTKKLDEFLKVLKQKYKEEEKYELPRLNEGTLFQRSNSKRWIAKLRIDGVQKHIASGLCKATVYKKLIEAIEEKYKNKNKRKGKKPPVIISHTLFSWLDQWHEVYRMPKKGKGLSHHTIAMDLSMIKKIKKTFKDIKLKQLKADYIQEGLNSITQGRTCEGVYTVLKLALAKAVDRTGGVSIMNLVERVRYQRVRGRALTKDEINELLDAALNEEERDIIRFYIYTGCRVGEIERILIQHIDLENNEIFIDGTKTKLSKRTMPIMPPLRPILERLSTDRAAEEKLFPNHTVALIRKFHDAIKEKTKIKFALKDYRHTAATNFKDAGIPSSVYYRWFGWADDTMARKVYTHETDYEKRLSQEWAQKFQ